MFSELKNCIDIVLTKMSLLTSLTTCGLLFLFEKVCPTFGSSIIKRVLDGFVTDEFCPEPISENVLVALESQVNFS